MSGGCLVLRPGTSVWERLISSSRPDSSQSTFRFKLLQICCQLPPNISQSVISARSGSSTSANYSGRASAPTMRAQHPQRASMRPPPPSTGVSSSSAATRVRLTFKAQLGALDSEAALRDPYSKQSHRSKYARFAPSLPCVPVPILVVSIMSVRVKPTGLCLRVATCLPSTAIDADSFLPQGDLLQLDALMMHWTLITANGTQPPSRSYHSMAAAGNALYLFGGLGEIGKRLSVFGLLDLFET